VNHAGAPTEPRDVVEAAGAVVWRVEDGELQVLLVHRPRYDDWSWPKGKLEPGEDIMTCAWREVLEETGRQVVLGRPLPTVTYPLQSGKTKLVRYWAARVATDLDNPALCARGPVPIASRREIDRSRWFPAPRAMKQLTRASDKEVLRKVIGYHRKMTLDTRAVVVIRHAQAFDRHRWTEGEHSRPLTSEGRARARGSIPMLAALGIRQVISSPWLRCRTTVRCYARRARLAVSTNRWLTEEGAKAAPARTARLMKRIVAGGPPVVVCSHRPVLPILTGEIVSRGGKKLAEVMGNRPLQTGEMAVAHVVLAGPRRGRVVAMERHRPPLAYRR
jgi:8-oxo-dGTP diphosphatase